MTSERNCEQCKHHSEQGCSSWDCEFEKRMTREEAIKLLEHISIAYTPTDAYGDYDDPQPYEEAIDMAIEALNNSIQMSNIQQLEAENGFLKEMVKFYREQQTDVVRCKDCKHYIVEGITTQYGWCHEYKHSVDEDDYCSYGERQCNYFGERREP